MCKRYLKTFVDAGEGEKCSKCEYFDLGQKRLAGGLSMFEIEQFFSVNDPPASVAIRPTVEPRNTKGGASLYPRYSHLGVNMQG